MSILFCEGDLNIYHSPNLVVHRRIRNVVIVKSSNKISRLAVFPAWSRNKSWYSILKHVHDHLIHLCTSLRSSACPTCQEHSLLPSSSTYPVRRSTSHEILSVSCIPCHALFKPLQDICNLRHPCGKLYMYNLGATRMISNSSCNRHQI